MSLHLCRVGYYGQLFKFSIGCFFSSLKILESLNAFFFRHQPGAWRVFCILCCKFFLPLFFFTLFCILIEIIWYFALVFMFINFLLGIFNLFWLHVKYCFVDISMYVILGLSLFQSIELWRFRYVCFPSLRSLWHDLSTNIMQTAWSCNNFFLHFRFFTLLAH